MENTSHIGPNVARCRKLRGMSQVELGRHIECSREFVGKIERGDKVPSVARLLDLACALGVTAGTLLKDRK